MFSAQKEGGGDPRAAYEFAVSCCPQGEASWELIRGVPHYFPSSSSKLKIHFQTAKSGLGCDLIYKERGESKREQSSSNKIKEQRWVNLPVSN